MFKQARFRLAVWNAIFIGVVIAVLLIYVYIFMKNEFYDETKRYIHHEIEELASIAHKGGGSEELYTVIDEELSISEEYNHDYILANSQGKVLSGNLSNYWNKDNVTAAIGNVINHPKKTYFEDVDLRHDKRRAHKILAAGKIGFTAENEPLYLLMLTDTAIVDKKLSKFRQNLYWALMPIILFVGCSGWLLAGMVLRPIGSLSRVMKEVGEGKLDRRVPTSGSGDEFDDLANSFNQMIVRIGESYDKVTQFTTNASHELNTPIAIMGSELDVILTKPRTNDEYKHALISQKEEVNRLGKLIQCLLWLARADADKVGLELKPLKVKNLLDELYESYEPLAEAKGVELKIDLNTEASISGDEMQLAQLLSNIVDNAIKYSPSGGRVKVSVDKSETNLTISVEDNGPGIPEDTKNKIFDRFYKTHDAMAGHGLGLNIARTIALNHKASIIVESAPAGGALFKVIFPSS